MYPARTAAATSDKSYNLDVHAAFDSLQYFQHLVDEEEASAQDEQGYFVDLQEDAEDL